MRRGAAVGFALVNMCIIATAAWTQTEFFQNTLEREEILELSRTGIELNSAGLEELISIPGMSQSTALAILNLRRELGCLRSLSDLLMVGGLTEPDIAGIMPYVRVDRECCGRRESLRGVAGCWSRDREGTAWASDLRFDSNFARLRLRRRPDGVSLLGGCLIRAGPASLTVGDLRGCLAPSLACGLGRGVLTLEGPLPRPVCSVGEKAASGAETEAVVTTGSSERLRGVSFVGSRASRVICAGGVLVKPSSAVTTPIWVVSINPVSSRACRIWSGSVVWGRPASGTAFLSAEWNGTRHGGSAQAALRRRGGAWLLSLTAAPERSRRHCVVVAGRWGKYYSPFGVGVFRKQETSKIASRVIGSTRIRHAGSLSFEQLIFGGGAGADGEYPKRVLKLRTRFRQGFWSECELRTGGNGILGEERRYGVKCIWRPCADAWAEILYKGHVGCHSALCGWRALLDRGGCGLELGAFSFRTAESLYFYEREIVGLSSIKALKGEGLGWYLYLRLGPSSGLRLLSFRGSMELKIRTVLRRESPVCETFVGVQLGRW